MPDDGIQDIADELQRMYGPEKGRPIAPAAPGLKRYAGLAVRGASLGLLGPEAPAVGFAEQATEFAGGIPTVGAISAITGPIAGAALGPLAKAYPIIPRLASAAMTGGVIGGAEAAGRGSDTPVKDIVTSAGVMAGQEALFLGAGKLIGLRKPPPVPGIATTASAAEENVSRTLGASTDESANVARAKAAMGDFDVKPSPTTPGPSWEEASGSYPSSSWAEAVGGAASKVSPENQKRFQAWKARYGHQTDPGGPLDLSRFSSHFDITMDPVENVPILTPKTNAAIDSIQKAAELGKTERTNLQERFPLSAVDDPRIDINQRREPLLTSNLTKLSEEEVQRVIDATPSGINSAEIVQILPSSHHKKIAALAERLGISPTEAKTSLERIRASVKDPSMRRTAVRDFLRRNCT